MIEARHVAVPGLLTTASHSRHDAGRSDDDGAEQWGEF
jgi:hypothetical protein